MTILQDRPATALLVIDVQNGVVAAAHQRDEVIDNINTVVAKARDAGVPVLWIQHNSDELVKDEEPWKIVPELDPRDGEPVIQKSYGDSFEDTVLESVLADLNVGSLVVTGAQTDACVRSTLHGAFTRGYDALLVSDAHTTEDLSAYGAPTPDLVIAHTNLYWKYMDAPGRTAGTVETKDVTFG
jgi:nicotinamidase-related amidase